MRRQGSWSRLVCRCLLAAGLAGISGCLSFVHPIGCIEPELQQTCACTPKCCRDHVYIFLMNGLDVVNCGNLAGLRDYLHDLGFNKIYYGQLYHVWWFQCEIARIHREDPDARFVLVGYDLGVNAVDGLARHVAQDGVQIDSLVFLSGNKGFGVPHSKPDNVARVLNILPDDKKAERSVREYADNTRLGCTSHLGAPSHVSTLQLLAELLTTVAATVPGVEPAEPV